MERKDTLCWECKKAITGECSWSNDFTPVEGWEATQTLIKMTTEKKEISYFVHSCPEFEKGR